MRCRSPSCSDGGICRRRLERGSAIPRCGSLLPGDPCRSYRRRAETAGPDSAGRYHRHGQTALYLTSSPEWATIAVSGYMREDGLPRVIVPVDLDGADVLDPRDEAACIAAGIDRDASGADWRRALAAGNEPPSWHVADVARAVGADGITDVSRHIPGGWHVALFRWNAPGAPQVEVVGEATQVVLP